MSSGYRKRPASYSSDEPSGKRPKSPKGIPSAVTFDNIHVPQGNDVNCWVCHLQGVRLFCKRCPKSFHPNCVMMGDGQSYQDYNCYECLNLIAARDPNYGFKVLHMFSMAEVCEIIKYLIRHLEVYAVFDVMPFRMDPGLSPEEEARLKRLPPTKSWDEIISLVENESYESLVQFRLDFFALIHQRVVLNRERYLPHAEAVQRKFDKEVSVLRLCPDCYIRANRMSDDSIVSNKEQPDNYFVGVCRLPHALVYAKYKNYPFWPAKVLHQYSGKAVKVRFFGDHTMSSCEFKNTTLLTETPPGGNSKKQNASFATSMAELNQHLEELRKVLGGPIKFAPPSKSYNNAKAAVLLKEQMPQLVDLLPQIDFNVDSFIMKRGSTLGPPAPMIPFLGEPVKMSVEELIATREGMIMKTMNNMSNSARSKAAASSSHIAGSSSKRKIGSISKKGTPKRSGSSLSQISSQPSKEPAAVGQAAQPNLAMGVTPITPASCNISEENILDLPRRGSKDKISKRDANGGGAVSRNSLRQIHVSVLDLKSKDDKSSTPKKDELRLRPRKKEGEKRGQEGKERNDEEEERSGKSDSSDSEDSGDEDYRGGKEITSDEDEEGRGEISDSGSVASRGKRKQLKVGKSEDEETSSDEDEDEEEKEQSQKRKEEEESEEEQTDLLEPAGDISDSGSDEEEPTKEENEKLEVEPQKSSTNGEEAEEEGIPSSIHSPESAGSGDEGSEEKEVDENELENEEEDKADLEVPHVDAKIVGQNEEQKDFDEDDDEDGKLEIDEKEEQEEEEEPVAEEKVEPTVPPLKLTLSPQKSPKAEKSAKIVKGSRVVRFVNGKKSASGQKSTNSRPLARLAPSPKVRRHQNVPCSALAAKRKSDLIKVLKRLQNTDAVLSRSPPNPHQIPEIRRTSIPEGLVIKPVGSSKKVGSLGQEQASRTLNKGFPVLAARKVDDNENHINEGVSVRKVVMTKHGLKKSAPTSLPEVLKPLAAKKSGRITQVLPSKASSPAQSVQMNGSSPAPPGLLPIGSPLPCSTNNSTDSSSPAVSLAKAIVSGAAVSKNKEGVFHIGSTVLSGPEVSLTPSGVIESPPQAVIDNQAAENELAKRKDLEFRRIITTSEEQKIVRLNLTPASCTVEKILEASRQPTSRVSIVRSNKGNNKGNNKSESPSARDAASSTASSVPSLNSSMEAFDGDSPPGDPLDTNSILVPHPALRNLVPGTIIRRAVNKSASIAVNAKNVAKSKRNNKKKGASVPYNPLEPQVVLEEGGSAEDPLAEEDDEDLIEDLYDEMDIKPDVEELENGGGSCTPEVLITPSVTSSARQKRPFETQLVQKKGASQAPPPPLVPVMAQLSASMSSTTTTRPAIIQVRDYGQQPSGPTVVGGQPVNLSIVGSVGQAVAMRSQTTSPVRPNSRGAAVVPVPVVPKDIEGLLSRLMQFTNAEVSAYVKDQIGRLEQVQQTRESTMNSQVRQMKATIEAITKENNQLHAEVSFLKNRIAEMEGRGVGVAKPASGLTSTQAAAHGEGNSGNDGNMIPVPPVVDLEPLEVPQMASVGVGTNDSGVIGGPPASRVNVYPKMMSGGTVGVSITPVAVPVPGPGPGPAPAPLPSDPPSPCTSEPRDLVIHEEEEDLQQMALACSVLLDTNPTTSSPVQSTVSPPSAINPSKAYYFQQPSPSMFSPGASSTSAAGSVIQTLTTASGTKLTVTRASTPVLSSAAPSAVFPKGSSSDSEKKKKRRRCGTCAGCKVPSDCGDCRACLNPRRHQVCRLRKCQALQRGKKHKTHQQPHPAYPRPAVTLHHRPTPSSHFTLERRQTPPRFYPVTSSMPTSLPMPPPPPPLPHPPSCAPVSHAHGHAHYHPPPVCQPSLVPRMPLQIMDPSPATLANLAAASNGPMPGDMRMGPTRFSPPSAPPVGVPFTSGFSMQSTIGGPRISLSVTGPPPLMHPPGHAGMNMVRPMGFYTR